jgi:hypothetical protein
MVAVMAHKVFLNIFTCGFYHCNQTNFLSVLATGLSLQFVASLKVATLA